MDWRRIENDKEKYAAYLCSREWAEKREAVRERAYGKCERCFIAPMEACHHLTYERKYNESLDDLQAICNECHDFTHGKSDSDPLKRGFDMDLDDFGHIKCPRCNNNHLTVISGRCRYHHPGRCAIVPLRCDCGIRIDVIIDACVGCAAIWVQVSLLSDGDGG